MIQLEDEGMAGVTEQCSDCLKIFPQSQLLIHESKLYCIVSCLKNAQKTKDDALDAYDLLIRDLREFEPKILEKPGVEEWFTKFMP